MRIAPLPRNESSRLSALRRYEILDTEPDEKLNALVKLASHICQTPLAAISLIDEKRQWVMAITGADVRETSRDIAFCSHTILQDDIMVVTDALLDERFFDHPNVACASGVRFYAGVPLATDTGENLGTLCVVDVVPRILERSQLTALKTLADQVMIQLNLRQHQADLKLHVKDIESKNRQLKRESEMTLALLHNASDGIHILDHDGNVIEASDSFCTMLGYTRSEVIGMNVIAWDVGHGTPESILFKVRKQFKSNERSQFETIHKRKDGSEFYAEISGLPLEFDGKPVLFNSSRDITERKRDELELHHSNRALNALTAVNRNLMYATDEVSLLHAVCKTIVKGCGYRLAWVGYLVHDAVKTILPVAQFGFEEGYLENAQIVWSETQRGKGPVGMAARTGNIQIVRNIPTDKSMRPWREEAIKRGYASGIALPLVNQGKVFGVLTIYAAQPDAINPDEAALLEEMANDLVFGLTSLHARLERATLIEQLSTSSMELERANTQIEEERARLSIRVLERTAQLQMANHAKDSFLATMSHEIRTPLAGLLGMMELLGLSRLDDEQHNMLNAAQHAGKSLLRIVNDILDWSKIEAGKLQLSASPTPLSDMFKSVTDTYAQIAWEKDILLSVDIDPALNHAYLFDPLRLSQILNNFTSNALKFTEQGSIRLSATRLAQLAQQDRIRFSVQDSGVGISPAQQERLFQQYEQASAETARMYGGTGLGLAICRRLAELMGGTLSVESNPGLGSTFSFTVDLPLAEADSAIPATASDMAAVRPLKLGERVARILIVDDHPLNRMLLKQQLDRLGVAATVAGDGAEALALWREPSGETETGTPQPYDLIITDCHMPTMDGYELTYRIRELEQQGQSGHVPIIAWTANVLAEEAERCHQAGMDDLLTKPTELAALGAMLERWLGQTSERSSNLDVFVVHFLGK